MNSHGRVPRAPRLQLRAPVDYRASPSSKWLRGWTYDISRSGVLFSIVNHDQPSGDLEFIVHLSRGRFHGPGTAMLPDFHYHGRVVRKTRAADGASLVAATIRTQTIRRRSP